MVENSIKRLENLLKWSDRLGSDEISEIKLTISNLKSIKKMSKQAKRTRTVQDNNKNFKGTIED